MYRRVRQRLLELRVSWKPVLLRAILRIDKAFDRLRPKIRGDRGVIEPYIGYSSPDGLVARGRVLLRHRNSAPKEGQGRFRNFLQVAARFVTREMPGVTIRACGTDTAALSDKEGYFTLRVAAAESGGGPQEIAAEIEGLPSSRVALPVIVTDKQATFGVISDIDDTIMRTGAYSLALNLWTTFTGNSMIREVFPDAVALIRRLHDGRNPVFFVSSSPWNLHDFLEQVFHRAGLVRGPLFLRDLGIAEDRFFAHGHGSHKGAAIDTILAANPGLAFVLIGDTGQHDAEVYLGAAKRHPGRVRRIILRAPGPGADEADKRFAEEAAGLGIGVSMGRDYRSLVRIHPGEKAEPDRAAIQSGASGTPRSRPAR